MPSRSDVLDKLHGKFKHLFETAWERRVDLSDVNKWSDQFQNNVVVEDDEQLQALYLLSNFIYFGQREIRELLRSLYRDLYKTPAIHQIRRSNANTKDTNLIDRSFASVLGSTRFLGVGNPSESGVHLLYFFRQENNLSKELFINTHRIFERDGTAGTSGLRVRDRTIQHYVFIDDICGSGTQAEEYSRELVSPLKAEMPNVKVSYFVLFATTHGLQAIRSLNRFDNVAAVFELDDSFKALEASSRIFLPAASPFDRLKVRATCVKYGMQIWPSHALGYKNGQLLIGFSHNTPDNTLPIFWGTARHGGAWSPVFKRYHKG